MTPAKPDRQSEPLQFATPEDKEEDLMRNGENSSDQSSQVMKMMSASDSEFSQAGGDDMSDSDTEVNSLADMMNQSKNLTDILSSERESITIKAPGQTQGEFKTANYSVGTGKKPAEDAADKTKQNSARYKNLRIDEVPDAKEDGEDSDEDTFMGRTVYKKQTSPASIESHLLKNDENMVHFKALTKFYGINKHLARLPECA